MGISLGTDYFTMLTPSLNHWIENTLIDACPGEFSCYPPDSMLHLCIAPDRVCDGIIDCAANFADEKGCPSGCSYDPYFDAYYTYYSGLQNSNVFIPADIYNFGGNYSSVHRGALRGWINDTSNDRNIIRFNQVDGVKVKSCNWVIKAPAGKVAVLVIPKINSNSDRNGGTTYIISGRRKIQHDRSSGPNYYTSIPGQSVTFMLSPINGQQYLSEIRTHHFEYYLEDIGECRNQHRCGDGRCVSPHKVCNGDFDCSDLSDEINCPSGCGDISLRIGASYGTFSSRNYPHSYKGSGDCLWIMLARSSVDGSSLGNQITLQFMDFVMSYKDILFVFNGVGRNKKIHDIFSGHQSPFNLTIPSSQVTLVLRNNDDIAERRMNGSYRITTSAVLN
uniref:CUB domain-containing protein n=1 Tax=Ciona savignyi TaxID=51511 RepID=H2Y859_CIOSA